MGAARPDHVATREDFIARETPRMAVPAPPPFVWYWMAACAPMP